MSVRHKSLPSAICTLALAVTPSAWAACTPDPATTWTSGTTFTCGDTTSSGFLVLHPLVAHLIVAPGAKLEILGLQMSGGSIYVSPGARLAPTGYNYATGLNGQDIRIENHGIMDGPGNTFVSWGGTTFYNAPTGDMQSDLDMREVGKAHTVINEGAMEWVTSYGPLVLVNSGTLGGVWSGGGDDVVELRPGSVISGIVYTNGGTNILRLGGSGSASHALAEMGSKYQSFTNIEKTGDSIWTLSGTTSLPLAIAAGTITGNASVNGLTMTGGTLTPGVNGVGSFTSSGGATLGADSTLRIFVQGASSTRLAVSSHAQLDGTLEVVLQGAQAGTYTILQGASVSGDFATVRVTDPMWRATTVNNGSAVVLTLDWARFQPAAYGSVAAPVLDSLRPSASADMAQVINRLGTMSAADQSRALSTMTPERQAGTPTVMAAQVNFFQGAVQNRVAQVGGSPRGSAAAPIQLALAGTHLEGLDGTTLYAGQSRWSDAAATGAWIAPWGGVARQKEGGGATGWNASSGGIAIGADTSLGEDLLGGVAAGWGRTEVSYGGVGGGSDNDTMVASLYGAWTPSPWTVDAGLTAALSRFDTTRKVLAAGETRIARSDYSGRTVAASLGGKRRFDADGLEISPDARLTATRWWLDGYDESGADSLNLHVDGRSGNRLRAETGVELASSFATESGRVRPWLRLAAAHDWTSGSRALQARFAGTAAAFAVDGKDDAGLRWLPGMGLSMDLSQSVEASLEYQAELRHDFQAHTGQMALRYKF